MLRSLPLQFPLPGTALPTGMEFGPGIEFVLKRWFILCFVCVLKRGGKDWRLGMAHVAVNICLSLTEALEIIVVSNLMGQQPPFADA